jgi:hypothetical protein
MDIAVTAVQLTALVLAAGWGYYRLWREGILRPRLEFSIDCEFLGPENGEYITQFILRARNKGLVRYQFSQIVLSVRGISTDGGVHFWDGMEPRIEFPLSILKADVIPDNYNFFFVEPGVEQPITYITKVSENIGYVLVKAEFQYDRFTPHSIAKAFQVRRSDAL